MRLADELVEHFFRHEYGRIVSVLTRSLGTRHLELVEDIVQTAMERALRHWGEAGVPDDPAAWLFQTARRLAIDALRRQRLHGRFLSERQVLQPAQTTNFEAPVFIADEIGDESLRMLFLCCHPSVPEEARVAFALKTVCGFSASEIARALFLSAENAQKRIERVRQSLREQALELEALNHPWMQVRLTSVHTVIYLLFNEGHFAARAPEPIHVELCQEAIRLGELLVGHRIGRTPETYALLAVMAFHAARLRARIDAAGSLILLDDQNRGDWDPELIQAGMHWMELAANGNDLSRYHIEAAIAWEHCRAPSVGETDWQQLLQLYHMLERIVPGPAQTMNLAIVEAKVHGPAAALKRLLAYDISQLPKSYPLWWTVLAELTQQAGDASQSREYFQRALANCQSPVERAHLEQRLKAT